MPITNTTVWLFQSLLHTPEGIAKVQAELKSIIYVDQHGQLTAEAVH